MQDEIIQIVSKFLKVDPSTVNNESIIDKTKVGGSIMMHRMYSNLAEAGYRVNDFLSVKTVGQLRANVSGDSNDDNAPPSLPKSTMVPLESSTVGVDIEFIDNLPVAVDYRSDGFYLDNFSPYEISYCLLKENPRASFAGLFAAKEAIFKLDNRFSRIPFSQIEIVHNEAGRPMYGTFDISISHAGEYAVAIAVVSHMSSTSHNESPTADNETKMMLNSLTIENKLIKQKVKINSFVLALVIVFLLVFIGFVLTR